MQQFGDVFYSEYFKSNAVVVDYIDDDNWYFVLEKYSQKTLRAQIKPQDVKWIREAE